MAYFRKENLRICQCCNRRHPANMPCFDVSSLISVNVIGGFLGAGKTTLLNYILEQKTEERIDVLVREYGAVPVDNLLIRNVSGNIHVFPGVTLHDDPQLVLHDYMHRLVSDENCVFDRLLMETSGIDSPESLMQLFMIGNMPQHYRLGSYVVVVDAQYGMLNLDEYEVAVLQVAYADVIIINKTDLASQAEIEKLEERVRSINALARILRATHGVVPLDTIMDIPLYAQLKQLSPSKGGTSMSGIETIVLSEKEPMNKAKVNAWLDWLFKESGAKLLRSKGFFCFAGEDWRYEFQAVRMSMHSKADQQWKDGEERKSTVVLIGENIPDEASLKASFASCVD